MGCPSDSLIYIYTQTSMMSRLFALLLLALSMLCSSCHSTKKSTIDYKSSSSMFASVCDSLRRQLSVQQLQLSTLDSHLVFVTVDPNVMASHHYDVILPDGTSLTLPGNATGYGVSTEAVRDTCSLTIDGLDSKSSTRYEGAAADTTYSSVETSEYKPPSVGIRSSLRIVFMTLGALAACALVFYFRNKTNS